MNQAAADSFATTIQETSLWLNSIGEKAGARDDKDIAWIILGATLHALRDLRDRNETGRTSCYRNAPSALMQVKVRQSGTELTYFN